MKKSRLQLLLALLFSLNAFADGFLVENYLGVNCIKHTVRDQESLYVVAKNFYVRPSTLAVVNSIENPDALRSGTVLYIPLTETNFYNTRGLGSSKFSFDPIYYRILSEQDWQSIATLFNVAKANLVEWNKGSAAPDEGQRVIVGWVKRNKQQTHEEEPFFVRKEKILFGNELERQEAREHLGKSKTKPISFVDNSIPESVIPKVDEKIEVKRTAQRNKPVRLQPSADDEIAQVVEPVKAEKKIEPVGITTQEKKFLEQAKPRKSKTNKPKKIIRKLRKLTRNSYLRDKQRLQEKEESRSPSASIDKRKQPEEDVTASRPLDRTEEKEQPIEVIDKSYTTKVIDTVIAEEDNEPVYVQHKIQRLTLLRNAKGRAAFFYSGQAGGKFYVFTNVAGKGSVVKLTNLNTGKYILAEVIGLLPEVDHERGYIAKLSDNAKRILGVSNKSFSVKINY